MYNMSKQYGLILTGQNKNKPTVQSGEILRPSIFEESSGSSDDDDDIPKLKKMKAAMGPGAMERRMARQMQAKALAEDPTVYQYDELYDEIEAKREEQQQTKSNEPKKPKYIGRLVKFAERRKLENELRIERQVQKEREAEGEEFKDKEAFVTTAYRKKLEEMRKLQEEEKRDEYLEAIGDVTKQKDLDGFYRHIYEQKLGTEQVVQKPELIANTAEGVDEDAATTYKPIKSGSKPQQRAYRKRKSSDDEDKTNAESEGDHGTKADEGKKVHLQNNIDADSDFSIDSSSESECDDDQKNTSSGKSESKAPIAPPKQESALDQTDPATIALTLSTSTELEKSNEKINTEKEPRNEIVQPEPPSPPKPKRNKNEIWKKRTVGEVFDAAVQRYYERKATRNG